MRVQNATAPKLEATTLHVDELIPRALQGRVRIPTFQRGLKWRPRHVQQLFDSIYRGYPIGTLLMWKRSAEGGEITLGPIQLEVDSTDDAWWVVDGQQRLTSLVATLEHPGPDDSPDPFVVYFDLEPSTPERERSRFFKPSRLRPVVETSMPLRGCLDHSGFQKWLWEFVNRTKRNDLIEIASEVTTRLRNYRVPVYVVQTDDPDVAREIFRRTNDAGRRLEAHEVFASLAPARSDIAQTPEGISKLLEPEFGAIEPNIVMRAAQAIAGEDTAGKPKLGSGVNRIDQMQRTEKALRKALPFLLSSGVHHLRLLPHPMTSIVVLAVIFDKFEAISDRSKRLLRRWLWRGFCADALKSDSSTLRRAVKAIGDQESASIQALLSQVPRRQTIDVPNRFNSRRSLTRVALIAMANCSPLDPKSYIEQHKDDKSDDEGKDSSSVSRWLDTFGAKAFTELPGKSAGRLEARFITPGLTTAQLRDQLISIAKESPEHPVLRSHLISPKASKALLLREWGKFLDLRRKAIEDEAWALYKAFAEPDANDRPALSQVVQ